MLGDRFQYTGKVDREVLLSLYQHSDYFLSASKHESFGIVYLEAMASGLPVISQYDERRSEIVGNAGYLLDCSDTTSFAKILGQYSGKPENAVKQAEKFDWKVLKPKYVELIEEVAS